MPEPIVKPLDRALYQFALLLVDVAIPQSRPEPPKPIRDLTAQRKRLTANIRDLAAAA